LTLKIPNSVLNSFFKSDMEDDFAFKVCSKVYKSSIVAASILSSKAFNLLKNECNFLFEI
jgi:hypothetical protein